MKPKIWAIADLHLSFGTPNKGMEVFGEHWLNHPEKIEKAWKERISPEDLVLIPGDISWAMKLHGAVPDLEWIDRLPGTKVISKGNHDLWWGSLKQIHEVLPKSLHILQNNAFDFGDISIGATRLWDSDEYNFSSYIEMKESPLAHIMKKEDDPQEDKRIFERDLMRLETSLKLLNPKSTFRIALVHYPPIGADLAPSKTSALLEKYKIDVCLFGHLHSVRPGSLPFGVARGVAYHLVACDYLDFIPLEIAY